MWLNSYDRKWLNFKRPLTLGKDQSAEGPVFFLFPAFPVLVHRQPFFIFGIISSFENLLILRGGFIRPTELYKKRPTALMACS
jgi:hypothetical protein